MRYLITGSAGFIGFHLARRLLEAGHAVVGYDSFTPYYDPALKAARNTVLETWPGFTLHRAQLEDAAALSAAWDEARPDVVVHLAAQAGVRYSIDHPETYVASNLVGTANVLEAARRAPPRHLMLASTSSAYGANTEMPFRETDRAVHPLTLYAATKGANELMAHSYAHLFGVPTTAFRFFTVYGPWGRPDMAPLKFLEAMLADRPIEVYGQGRMSRDFTYVDDLVEAVVRLADCPPPAPAERTAMTPIPGDSLSPAAPYRMVNIGGGSPTGLMDFIEALETALGRTAKKVFLPMQEGDVPATWASANLLEALIGYRPATPVIEGVARLVAWRREYGARI
ncbi:NAD-dependent epimerase/dehydratase family protein [Brevundimonas sp. VNH65]|uniref:NAD-dependent epimerase/dehydratase family protein n=1 Tax=Brevundimonas sp. VNH65 TaxID=3400917 RepID=UPI003BFD7ED3